MTGEDLPAGLHVVGTPLGNLGDLSPRAAATLRGADVVACEDTRRTGVLMRHAGAETRLLSLHAHNEAERVERVLSLLAAGARVALVSDAGMPAVSDPGARLVDAVHAAGLPVHLVPGPSAVTTALAATGAPADRFAFAGFLPRRDAERAALLDGLDPLGLTIVAFESPHRLPAALAWLAGRDPGRRTGVCREMTKRFEEVAVATAADLAEHFAGDVRGEATLVLWPATPVPGGGEAALAATLEVLLAAGLSPARAADAAAALGAGSRNAAYRAALTLASRRAT
ncbi:MAG TPA: 16S rRNA (cytidine(1402)-2'-O)-methyltransferase [Miltoncostaeaceae bacterium]|nr:16S rRNA (cytidine(1402)-2'-O)-methyltransferase [Miltoncostaeaceae bacterium]